jgi:uncharacterized protein
MEQVEQLGQQMRLAGGAGLQTQLLVLQPTPFCNIDCSYCYLPARQDTRRMDLATVRAAARHLRDDGLLGERLGIVWHAGEPLVLPPAWYETAFEALAEELAGVPQLQVTQALQTNATLIDDAWCDFFLRHGVQLGVSVDGPAALHDRHRRTRRGAGTHGQVVQGIRRLQDRGVPFHAIAVVTAATLADPAGFFDWFEAQGIRELGCNIDEAEGAHARSSLQAGPALEAAHAAFLREGLRRHQAGRLVLREVAQAQQLLAAPLPRWQAAPGVAPWPANAQVQPLALLTVLANGDFGSFSPELPGQPWPAYADFVLGNVHRGGYLQALQGPAFQRLWADIRQGVQACASACPYFEQCGGGAPANKLYEHGHLHGTETLYCRSMVQRPFDAVLAAAEQALWPQRQEQAA